MANGRKTGGRVAGVPNRATAAARQSIALFVENNVDRLQGWLDDIAADEKLGPKVAYECFMNVVEYHVPKLARTEVVGDPDNPLKTSLEVTFK
jgi:hypothetical protein